MWSRYAKKVNPVLNASHRSITACFKPVKVDNLYLLSGIVPPFIRRAVHSELENLSRKLALIIHSTAVNQWQLSTLSNHWTTEFLDSVCPCGTAILTTWDTGSLSPIEPLPTDSSNAWPFWSYMNNFQTTAGCCRTNFQTWGCATDDDPNCQCGPSKTIEHLVWS